MATHGAEHPSRLTRRDFLKLAVAAAGGGALALAEWKFGYLRRLAGLSPPFSPDQPLPPTASPSSTPDATATSQPTNTPDASPTPEFPQLLVSEVSPYAAALGYTDVEVVNRVEVSNFTDPQGRRFQAAVDPETATPLLVTTERGEWQRASLRSLADKSGINVGVLYDGYARFNLGTEFNYGLISSGWEWSIQSSGRRDLFTFYDEDNRIMVARQQGIDNF